ncbi:MAG: hypothetical protein JSR18_07195 [Proteobacteria bacterium]|nr:hypothetical protein [Pseudomonadota bacterium]
MQRKTLAVALVATLAMAGAASAQTATDTQRNVDQQQRIENGLQSGQLNTHEAARLEQGEAKIDRMESHAAKDGNVSAAEAAKIQNAQNRESKAIYAQKHDAQKGNPASASSSRMQADVQRNVDQQARIQQGVANGSLTTQEAGKLEHGQARDSRKEAVAGADGHVGAGEQARIQRNEDAQSARIHHKKHNAKVAAG